jgi:hypothetical protein
VRIYKTRWVARFTRREGITDEDLIETVKRAEQGLIDADLGGGLIKQRIARAGRERSGGYRMLLAYRKRFRAVFLYGFAKSERGNVERDELLSLREIGAGWLGADAQEIARGLGDHAIEVIDDDKQKEE